MKYVAILKLEVKQNRPHMNTYTNSYLLNCLSVNKFSFVKRTKHMLNVKYAKHFPFQTIDFSSSKRKLVKVATFLGNCTINPIQATK